MGNWAWDWGLLTRTFIPPFMLEKCGWVVVAHNNFFNSRAQTWTSSFWIWTSDSGLSINNKTHHFVSPLPVPVPRPVIGPVIGPISGPVPPPLPVSTSVTASVPPVPAISLGLAEFNLKVIFWFLFL